MYRTGDYWSIYLTGWLWRVLKIYIDSWHLECCLGHSKHNKRISKERSSVFPRQSPLLAPLHPFLSHLLCGFGLLIIPSPTLLFPLYWLLLLCLKMYSNPFPTSPITITLSIKQLIILIRWCSSSTLLLPFLPSCPTTPHSRSQRSCQCSTRHFPSTPALCSLGQCVLHLCRLDTQ